ncbi:MAG: TIGR02679 family protein [Kineosporiaceae bacterium]
MARDPLAAAVPDADRLRRVLGGPELAWLLERCRSRIEQGRDLQGAVTRSPASAEERAAVARLLGRRSSGGGSVSLRLEALEAELRDSGVAKDLRSAIEVLTGPIRDRAGERSEEHDRVGDLTAELDGGPHRSEDWYRKWVAMLQADGTLTRLVRRGEGRLVGQAVAVLACLPADSVLAVPVLAERVVGDTKALSATPLARLVLRALAIRAGTAAPRRREEVRRLWTSAGVVADDLSSQVLVLNVRMREGAGLVGRWVAEAADAGVPFRITLHQWGLAPLVPVGPDLFVCENPAVLRTAAAELGRAAAPLLCTEGVPSAAGQLLVEGAARAGVRVHWHADLDWTGLRTTADAVRRYGARPWRMGASDYEEGLTLGESEALRGSPADSPWDPPLAGLLHRHGRAVMEERLLAQLVGDLRPPRGG